MEGGYIPALEFRCSIKQSGRFAYKTLFVAI